MAEDPEKQPLVSQRQFLAAIATLIISTGVNNAVPLLSAHGPDAATEKAISRIADELGNIRGSLVSTQIEMTKALATAMAELSDHSRRLESLEDKRRR